MVSNGNRRTRTSTFSPWRSLMVTVVLGAGVAAWIIAELTPVTWLYLTGTRTTVRVERCETVVHFRGESTHCEGSWPLPATDRRGEGRIDHAGASTEGKRMSARATGDHATVITAPELFWRDLLGAAVIAGEIAFLIAQTVKLREHRSSRP